MYTTHSSPSMAQAVAVATPCWPAPVSADDAPLAHVLRQERLTQGIVYLVSARVGEVLPLQVDASASEPLSEVAGEVKGRRPGRE